MSALTMLLMLLLGAAIGLAAGRVLYQPRHRPPAICGCGHHLAFHDVDGCHHQDFRRCGCTGYLSALERRP